MTMASLFGSFMDASGDAPKLPHLASMLSDSCDNGQGPISTNRFRHTELGLYLTFPRAGQFIYYTRT